MDESIELPHTEHGLKLLENELKEIERVARECYRIVALANKVREMRAAQQKYAKSRTAEDRKRAREAEHGVDAWLYLFFG